MSNYTQTTFFTPKDALPITDPNKTIFGAAYDVEFANLSAAIATKLDSTFSNPSLLSLNITGNATPANGIALNGSNTLAFYANSTLVATFTTSAITFIPAVNFSLGSSIVTAGGFNCNASTVPANGIYLPSANTLGFATNTSAVGSIASNGGMVWGSATGGTQGAGSINAQSMWINGVQLYASMPITNKTTNYTPVLADANAGFSTANASITFTIPSNASVAYPIGTFLMFFATSTNTVSLAITSDTMTLAGSTTTGSRTIAQNSYASAVKVGTTNWIVSGPGLT